MKKGNLALILLCIFCLQGLFPTKNLWAQTPLFFDDIGAGPRAIAMGQAFTAVADDPSAAYYNPAGLSQLPTAFTLILGYQYSKPMIYIDARDKQGNPHVQNQYLQQIDLNRSEDVGTRGMFIGAGANFDHFAAFNNPSRFMRRIAFGFTGFFSIPDIMRFWNPQRKQDPYHLRYHYGYCLMNMAVSVSCRIMDYLSVGIGVMPRVDTFQNTENSYIDVNKPDDPFRLRLKTQVKMYASWVFGLRFQPPILGLEDKLALGLSYRKQNSGYYGTGYGTQDMVTVDPETGDKRGTANKYFGIFPRSR